MAKAEIEAGICGFHTVVETYLEGRVCKLSIESGCANIRRLADQLTEVDPYQEITYRRNGPLTLQKAALFCAHTACPVPVGIIKAIEVEAGLALPAEVSIKLSKDEPGT